MHGMWTGNLGVIRSGEGNLKHSSLPQRVLPDPEGPACLRFERGDRSSTTSRGIDHIVIFAIGHIEPKALPCTDIYPSEPEYNPDFQLTSA
jgi:hypothetical protein